MKKIFKYAFVIITLISTLLLCSCESKDIDNKYVVDIVKISSEGLIDTYNINYSDGSTYTFTITNGKDGESGADGKDGNDGATGKSAFEIYKEYYPDYSGDEKQWIEDLINGRLISDFKVKFSVENAKVIVYKTQDLTSEGIETLESNVYNSDTGEIDNSGNGQLNFKVIPIEGYEVISVKADTNYKNLKTSADGLENNSYRLTKVTGNVNITVVTRLIPEECNVKFVDKDSTIKEFSIFSGEIIGEENYPENPVADLGYKFLGWYVGSTEFDYKNECVTSDLEIVAKYTYDSLTLPIITIDTENSAEIVSKEEYISCNIAILNASEEYNLDSSAAQIKGRGNSTWELDKKPYKFKFESKKDLFGFGKSKKWVLLANYMDTSLLRNYISYNMALNFDCLSNTSKCIMIDLYLNGRYDGVYLLCEQVETGSTRVDIKDDITLYSPEEIGYLLELDYRFANQEGINNFDYFMLSGYAPYAIKSPDTEDANYTNSYCAYIKNYVNTAYGYLWNQNWDMICTYIDVDSFAECYIMHELFSVQDTNFSSFYIYKEGGANGKLYCGPIWDFDLGSGNSTYNSTCHQTNYLYAKYSSDWYNCLLKMSQFNTIVTSKMNKYSTIINNTINDSFTFASNNKAALERNFVRWNNVLGVKQAREPDELVACKTYDATLTYLQNWLNAKWTYMKSIYK